MVQEDRLRDQRYDLSKEAKMALVIGKKSPVATISKELKQGKNTVAENVTSETVKMEPGMAAHPSKIQLEMPYCTVGVEASYTHNLGNYQSARIGVSLTVPCTHGEINEIYKFAQAWVDERMSELQEELTKN
jgi:hypothetical protein